MPFVALTSSIYYLASCDLHMSNSVGGKIYFLFCGSGSPAAGIVRKSGIKQVDPPRRE